ncbi:MAG: 2-hydroxyacyl-CoA dehydratase family protein [Syntrophales bacterium]|nr:2-hydroxyacyl-CoA dehydratase family protein [Syntrophales bacterium]
MPAILPRIKEKRIFMNTLDQFLAAAEHPERYAAKLKSEGASIIAFLCSYTPEELIHAAGLHPMRLFGTRGPIMRADGHLQAYCCSLARGTLEQALAGDLSFLDGAVFPHTCDTIQRLSDIWRLNTSFGFFADVVLPVKLDSKSAQDYFADVLGRFKAELEEWTGREITEDSLRRSIETFNAVRSSLERLYRLRSADPGIMAGSRMAAVIRGSMIMDRNELPGMLDRLIEEAESGIYREPPGKDKKRLILSGGICDHPDFYTALEDSGGVVAWDDLCTGSRFFNGTTETSGNLPAALARRYSRRLICPAKHLSTTARAERLLEIVREHRADGVIFFLLKFCDPHAFDYPWLKEFLEKHNVPNTLIEVEHQLPPEGQLKTRLETFIQTL